MTQALTIRLFTEADTPAIAAIYSHHVLTGTATFEEVPPDTDEMLSRLSGLADQGFPVLVACTRADEVIGYAYAGPIKRGLPTGSRLKIRFIFIMNICAKGPGRHCYPH